jgi:lipopolysaccharide export LptBFGC system permease protein LptF
MALLGATLALVYFFPGMSIARILGVAIYGNIAYVGFSAAGMLSTFGNLPPVAGPWLLPAALTLGCPLVLAWRDRGVRVRLRRHGRAAPA